VAVILGIMGSPRKGGNSDHLLSIFLDEFRGQGHIIRQFNISDMNISPCMGCGFCEIEGFCKFSDDMEEVNHLLRMADLVILSTPIFFYGMPSQTKALIDRVQALWARRYRFKLKEPKADSRRGFLLSVGATRGKNLFLGVELTCRYFFDAISASFEGYLGFREVDRAGEIVNHPTAFKECRDKAREFLRSLNGRKRILFICQENARRSQMAQAFLEYYGKERFDVQSAGNSPASRIDPVVIEVMAERGIDIAYRRPKAYGEICQAEFDLIVQMGCEIQCPAGYGSTIENWDLEDPKGKSKEDLSKIRDQIEHRVKNLISKT